MPHQVKALRNNVNLPNGFYVQSGQSVILDDTEFARLAQDVFSSGTLQDLGYVTTAGPSSGTGVTSPGGSIFDQPTSGIYRASIWRDDLTSDVAAALATGVMTLSGIYLQAGDTVSRIGVPIGNTAAGTPTHSWTALYTTAGVLMGQSADQAAAAIAANGVQDLALVTPQVISTSGVYYAAYMVAATTVPSLLCMVYGRATVSTGWLTGQSVLAGTAGTALTTTAPAAAGTITAVVNRAMMYAH
jgi:hypothetical protein